MIPQELINKFFRNECNEDERKRVLQYFEENPAEWDKYMNEEDWDSFTTEERLHPAISKRLLASVERSTFRPKRFNGRRFISIAATLVLLAGLAWVVMMQQGSIKNLVQETTPELVSNDWNEKVNSTDKPLSFDLPDGSTVILSPKSTVRYYPDFETSEKRNIFLNGQALFKVAKDAQRPFTVYADAVATTALGTEFTVTSFSESNEISVALHEGKVVVSASDSVHKKWKNNMYLAPGDLLVYNKQTMLASVRRTKNNEQLVKAGTSFKTSGTIQKPDWYEFNGKSLAEVLDQLSAYYQVDIYYYPADIRNKYFSARLRNTDSLENILRDIALLNRLSIEKRDSSYIIKKN